MFNKKSVMGLTAATLLVLTVAGAAIAQDRIGQAGQNDRSGMSAPVNTQPEDNSKWGWLGLLGLAGLAGLRRPATTLAPDNAIRTR